MPFGGAVWRGRTFAIDGRVLVAMQSGVLMGVVLGSW